MRGTSMRLGWRKWRGVDFGFNDAFFTVWVAHNPDDDCYYVYHEYVGNKKSPGENAKAVLGYRAQEHIERTYSDSYLETIATLKEQGSICQAAHKGAGSVEAGIQIVKQLLAEGRLKIAFECKTPIGEFEMYRYDDRTGKIALRPHVNGLDALRYVIYESAGRSHASFVGFVSDFKCADKRTVPLELVKQEEPRVLFGYDPSTGAPIWMKAA